MDPRAVARALADIAATASETLELQDVFDRVATSVRELIPLDNMGVVRILDGDKAVVHATTVPCHQMHAECWAPEPLDSWSPRLRPRPATLPRIDDATQELDPGFPVDAAILSKGVRSALWEPFRTGDRFTGGVWLASYQPKAFTDEHQEVLRPIAALLGSAVEHWRMWDAERRRRERMDQLEELLATFAEALDVREIWERLSEAAKPILPHHLMVLTELDVRARSIRFAAMAGTADTCVPTDPIAMSDAEMARRSQDFEIFSDLPAQVQPTTERERLLLKSGMRSWLRVPVRLAGEVRGSLGFFDRAPSRYDHDDVEVASRLADRIALMFSHHQLAEEARLAAEARERAERLAATVETLTRQIESRNGGRITGASRPWKQVMQQVGRVASSETTVLITGESGTGKEVVSHLVHQGSPRVGKPFVAINCAALPEQLLESELFGHEKGAFTGADGLKVGRIEQAAGGTLFLDEIGEMSPLVQAKFLRVLQEREFQRVGGTRTLRADVRVIAATNRDLAVAIARQQFREDLYYRLNVFEIHVPPLRERSDDILLLAEAFLEDLGRTMGRPAAGISRDARDWLLSYAWPGNVRELRNAIERAILLCDGGLVTRAHLPASNGRANGTLGAGANGSNGGSANGAGANGAMHGASELLETFPADGVDLEAVERSYVQKALGQTNGNKSKAARLLGLTRAQLYTRLEKYGLH